MVDLQPHEDLVLDWLFAGWAPEADLNAKRAAIRADPVQWSALWVRFVDDVEALGRASGLIEREVASPGVLAVAAAGLGVLVVGVVGTAHGYIGWLACVVAGSFVLAGASPVAPRSARPWRCSGRPSGPGCGRGRTSPRTPWPARGHPGGG